MDISIIGSVSAAVSQAATGDAIAIAVLRKTLDLQAQGALQLIQALPQPASVASVVDGLGQGVDTFV